MTSQKIVAEYLNFFKRHGHKQISNVSLIPENDPTLLYVNSGMFPLVPYLSGEPHPLGKRLVNIQRSLRFFEDLDNVGNTNRHTTAFHMLGNWSLGDYFKDEQLNWIYEFYIEKLGLDINRIYATVFEGDKYTPKDDESIKILKNIFKKYGITTNVGERIFAYGRDDNWWQRGETIGELGGPDSEIFYYLGKGSPKGKSPAKFQDEFLEIGNSVFMQYKKSKNDTWEELRQKNVDFGGGLERLALAVQGKTDIFQTDNFWPIIEDIQKISGLKYLESHEITKAMRVMADHMRASVFLTMDGIYPSNKDQGYILRRLIRRMVRHSKSLGVETNISAQLAPTVTKMLAWIYPDLTNITDNIQAIFSEEESKFRNNIKLASNLLPKINLNISSLANIVEIAFDLYQSKGYPPELFIEEIKTGKPDFNEGDFYKQFKEKFKKHQEISKKGAESKFKGGLADHKEQTVKYHTTTHLIHQALYDVLGKDVKQAGSNITDRRLRFDFCCSSEVTDKKLKRVESIVNTKIEESLPVYFIMMSKTQALELGAKAFFKQKYPDTVKAYFIGDKNKNKGQAYSIELCGGPHVNNTSIIKNVRIYKFQSLGTNNYRIYAK